MGENCAAVKVDSVGELCRALEACAVLGINDVTVTSTPRPASGLRVAGFAYHLDGRSVNPLVELAKIRGES